MLKLGPLGILSQGMENKKGYTDYLQAPYVLIYEPIGHLDDGTTVQISKCPNDHGKIKSPLCCGEDMSCSVS